MTELSRLPWRRVVPDSNLADRCCSWLMPLLTLPSSPHTVTRVTAKRTAMLTASSNWHLAERASYRLATFRYCKYMKKPTCSPVIRFPQRLNWILPSSGLLRGVRWFNIDVSGLPIEFMSTGPIGSPETSVSNYVRPRNNPENRRIHLLLPLTLTSLIKTV